MVHRTIIGSCQTPTRSDFAASAASASAGSGRSFGFAHPCRTSQVERSVPETAQRAVNDFCSPGLGQVADDGAGADQLPQRRLRCGAAGPALALLVLALSVGLAATMPFSLMTTSPASRVPLSGTMTR